MSKIITHAGLATLALLASASLAAADSNIATIAVQGNSDSTLLDQTGTGNTATVTQNGNSNSIKADAAEGLGQSGNNSSVSIEQTGTSNTLSFGDKGTQSKVKLTQDGGTSVPAGGTGNVMSATIASGTGNGVAVNQIGLRNTSTTKVTGSNNNMHLVQDRDSTSFTGQGNSMTTTVNGSGNTLSSYQWDANALTTTVTGSNNTLNTEQASSGTWANRNTANAAQNGNSNTLTISQVQVPGNVPPGGSVTGNTVTAVQTGDSNQGTVWQASNNNTAILHQNGNTNYASTTQSLGTNNVLNLLETGNRNHGTVTQSGTGNIATVSLTNGGITEVAQDGNGLPGQPIPLPAGGTSNSAHVDITGQSTVDNHQVGVQNTSDIVVNGTGDSLVAAQDRSNVGFSGPGNSLAANIKGNNFQGTVYQYGANNATLRSTGNGNSMFVESGNDGTAANANTVELTQTGNNDQIVGLQIVDPIAPYGGGTGGGVENNLLLVTQSGSQDYVYSHQIGNNNATNIAQNGNNDSFVATQNGVGDHANVQQNGSGLSGSVNQTGNGLSVNIVQGTAR